MNTAEIHREKAHAPTRPNGIIDIDENLKGQKGDSEGDANRQAAERDSKNT